jgi:hypothetical protein
LRPVQGKKTQFQLKILVWWQYLSL